MSADGCHPDFHAVGVHAPGVAAPDVDGLWGAVGAVEIAGVSIASYGRTDAVLAVVRPLLDALTAERDEARAEAEGESATRVNLANAVTAVEAERDDLRERVATHCEERDDALTAAADREAEGAALREQIDAAIAVTRQMDEENHYDSNGGRVRAALGVTE